MKTNPLHTHAGEIAREIRAERFDLTERGLYMPRLGVAVGGALKVRRLADPGSTSIEANLIPGEGLVHVLNSVLPPQGGYSAITAWYLAPFKNNYTPDAAIKASTFVATAGEFTDYVGATRPAIVVPAAATTPSTQSNEVILTLNGTGPHNIYGAVLVSNSAKGNGSGKMLSAIRFENPRIGLPVGDKIGMQYVLSASDADA